MSESTHSVPADQCQVPIIGIEKPRCSNEGPVPAEHVIAAVYEAIDDADKVAKSNLSDELSAAKKEWDAKYQALLGHSSSSQRSSVDSPEPPVSRSSSLGTQVEQCQRSAAFTRSSSLGNQVEQCQNPQPNSNQHVALDIRSPQSILAADLPILEATAVPQEPVYDAVVLDQNTDHHVSWWKQHQKHLLFGLSLLVIGILAGVVGSRSYSKDNESIEPRPLSSTQPTPAQTTKPATSTTLSTPETRPTSSSTEPTSVQSEPSPPSMTTSTPTDPSTVDYWDSKQLGQTIIGAVDWSGHSLALSSDGMILAIGDPHSNISGYDSGNVRVFVRYGNGTNWRKLGRTIIGAAVMDMLGTSVALSANGMALAVGIPRFGSDSRGQVKIYEWNGGALGWELNTTFYGESHLDLFGQTMSLSEDGKTLAVGAPLSIEYGDNSGHVRVFGKNDDSIWSSIGQVIHGDTDGDHLGSSVSLSVDGKILAIGADNKDVNGDYSGQVTVYTRPYDASNWKQRGEIIKGEAAGDRFGSSVFLSADGKTLAIGAPYNDNNDADSGTVHIYTWADEYSSWIQLGHSIKGEGADDMLGHTVSVSADGKTLAIGAPAWSDRNGEKYGSVSLYQLDEATSEYIKLIQDIAGHASGYRFGLSVALSADGKVIAIGANKYDANDIASGKVKVFRVEN